MCGHTIYKNEQSTATLIVFSKTVLSKRSQTQRRDYMLHHFINTKLKNSKTNLWFRYQATTFYLSIDNMKHMYNWIKRIMKQFLFLLHVEHLFFSILFF